MERGNRSIAFLDTHIVVWLYAGLKAKFTRKAKNRINTCELYLSQLVRLELQYLYEIGRITEKPEIIIRALAKDIGLKLSEVPLCSLIDEAIRQTWTRDVFDRLIVAETIVSNAVLITADKDIRKNFNKTVW